MINRKSFIYHRGLSRHIYNKKTSIANSQTPLFKVKLDLVFFLVVSGVRTPDLAYIMHYLYQLNQVHGDGPDLDTEEMMFPILNIICGVVVTLSQFIIDY